MYNQAKAYERHDHLHRNEHGCSQCTQVQGANTSIAQIGTMVLIVDLSSLCINMGSIITAITTTDSPPPILCLFLMKFIRIINNTEWAQWYNATHTHMPLLHWYCYSFLEKVFNHIANFATNFGNTNVAAENQSISELNI
jgi:hypothetical protein